MMNEPRENQTKVGGHPRVVARLSACWLFKTTGMTLGLSAFFVAYFWVLQHPAHVVVVMPVTAIDRLIGFWPEALPLYLSLWLYVSLAPALMTDRRDLMAYAVAAVGLSLVGLGIFHFWPTMVPTLAVDWSQHPAFVFLKSIDASGNACPSLHVAFAVFTAASLRGQLREMAAGFLIQAVNVLWCLGILYSTIATGQHVAIDVLAGTVAGVVFALLHARLRWRLRTFPPQQFHG